MKVLALPIEVISYTNDKGDLRPLRFRMKVDDECMQVIKVDKVISKETEKLAGNNMIVYKCQSIINDILTLFEIKYELATCKWILFKI